MPRKPSKTIEEQKYEANLKIYEAQEAYETQLYFETMPEYDPQYSYCFQTSNRSLSYEYHSVDAWIRAVIKHLGQRRRGHGGETTKAILISIPDDLTEKNFENWFSYQTEKIRKKTMLKKRNKGL